MIFKAEERNTLCTIAGWWESPNAAAAQCAALAMTMLWVELNLISSLAAKKTQASSDQPPMQSSSQTPGSISDD